MLVWLGLLYYGPQWWPLSVSHELAPGCFDQAIPFIPNTAWIYQSLFLLLPLAVLIQPTKRDFVRFCLGFCASSHVFPPFSGYFPLSFAPLLPFHRPVGPTTIWLPEWTEDETRSLRSTRL
jgi:hypothetical protein